jgi:peptidoglycan/xylan/chitin deacetylase (PgdA/CDA1 family)
VNWRERYNKKQMVATLLAIGGAAAAATFAGFHTMWPTSQLYGRAFLGLSPGTRKLALTYDDGPNDPHTLHLLDVLASHDVKATFFMLGKFVAERPQIVRRVAAEGHVIGNHTWSHPNLIFASPSKMRAQIENTRRALEDAVGEHSRLFRPPFGGRRPGTFALARAMGLEPIMWRVSSYDWSAKSSEQITARIASDVRGGDVILMHDGDHLRMGADRSHTVRATDSLIRRYKSEGYEFVTVPEMMQTFEPVLTKRA